MQISILDLYAENCNNVLIGKTVQIVILKYLCFQIVNFINRPNLVLI